MNINDFVDLIIKRSKDKEDDDQELDSKGHPYRDCRHKVKRIKADERAKGGMHNSLTDKDILIFDYEGDIDPEDDDEKLSDELKQENIRRFSRTSPSIISVPKISEAERKLLLKHSGLLNNRKHKTKIVENKQAKDFLIERAGIQKNGIAKNVIADLETKRRLS